MMNASSLPDLKAAFSDFLVAEDALKSPAGLPTGILSFDERLLWKGLPRGEISLFMGTPGSGLTSLWLKAAGLLHQQERWAAWLNSEWRLYPQSGDAVRWDRLMVLEKPTDPSLFFWILQEMITSRLFDLIGCHLSQMDLKRHQLIKLKALVRQSQVALVFLSPPLARPSPLYALILESQRDHLCLRRALHRQSDQVIQGVLQDARSLPAL